MSLTVSNLRPAGRVRVRETSLRNSLTDLAAGMTGVITLSRGDPDLPTPRHIIEAAQKSLAEGATHYTNSTGIKELRSAIAQTMADENATDYDRDEIIVTAGGQEAVACTMLALINPGDEVIVQVPGYSAYFSAVELAGGKIVYAETTLEENFILTAAHVEKLLTPRSRMLCLINPNNPTSTIVPPNEIEKIAKLCVEKDLILVSDEIYGKLTYDNQRILSPASLPGLKERTITVNGFSKAYAMTGWRVGWLAAPKTLMPALADIHHTLAICATASSQHGALAALTGPQDGFHDILATYTERRRIMVEGLASLGLPHAIPGGGLYVFAKVTDTGMNLDTFCLKLLREARVLVSPGTFFGNNEFVRISLLAPTDQIREALDRMHKVLGRA